MSERAWLLIDCNPAAAAENAVSMDKVTPWDWTNAADLLERFARGGLGRGEQERHPGAFTWGGVDHAADHAVVLLRFQGVQTPILHLHGVEMTPWQARGAAGWLRAQVIFAGLQPAIAPLVAQGVINAMQAMQQAAMAGQQPIGPNGETAGDIVKGIVLPKGSRIN